MRMKSAVRAGVVGALIFSGIAFAGTPTPLDPTLRLSASGEVAITPAVDILDVLPEPLSDDFFQTLPTSVKERLANAGNPALVWDDICTVAVETAAMISGLYSDRQVFFLMRDAAFQFQASRLLWRLEGEERAEDKPLFVSRVSAYSPRLGAYLEANGLTPLTIYGGARFALFDTAYFGTIFYQIQKFLRGEGVDVEQDDSRIFSVTPKLTRDETNDVLGHMYFSRTKFFPATPSVYATFDPSRFSLMARDSSMGASNMVSAVMKFLSLLPKPVNYAIDYREHEGRVLPLTKAPAPVEEITTLSDDGVISEDHYRKLIADLGWAIRHESMRSLYRARRKLWAGLRTLYESGRHDELEGALWALRTQPDAQLRLIGKAFKEIATHNLKVCEDAFK